MNIRISITVIVILYLLFHIWSIFLRLLNTTHILLMFLLVIFRLQYYFLFNFSVLHLKYYVVIVKLDSVFV